MRTSEAREAREFARAIDAHLHGDALPEHRPEELDDTVRLLVRHAENLHTAVRPVARQGVAPRNLYPASIAAAVIAVAAVLVVAFVAPPMQGQHVRVSPANVGSKVLPLYPFAAAPPPGVQSFHFVQRETTVSFVVRRPDTVHTREVWGVLPDRWRVDIADGECPQCAFTMGIMTDGVTITHRADYGKNTLGVRQSASSNGITNAFVYGTTSDLISGLLPSGDDFIEATRSQCYPNLMLRGEEVIIGRVASVIDLGAEHCERGQDGQLVVSTTPREKPYRLLVWVDKDTGIVLKQEQYNGDGVLTVRSEMLQIEINGPIAGDIFVFTPPPGVKIVDTSPRFTPVPQTATLPVTATPRP